MPRFFSALCIFLITNFVLTAEGNGAKPTVPSKDQQEPIRKMVKDMFEADYAKRGLDDQRALAKTLYAQGLEAGNPADQRYVLLDESSVIAAGSGDAEQVVLSVGAMESGYATADPLLSPDLLPELYELLKTTAKKIQAEDAPALFAAGMLNAHRAIAKDDFRLADKFALLSVSTAQKSKNSDQLAEAGGIRDMIKSVSSAYRKVQKAKEALIDNPDDPEANQEYGEYLFLHRRD